MFEIDGAQKSGSGTILRLSVALATVIGKPLHIYNIRQNRPQPGLQPMHLEAVLTSARLCNAEVEGATLHSRELWFTPGEIRSGNFEATIGTAGSISALTMAVLPICASAKNPVRLHIAKGGTDVSHSPTISYMTNVFLPILRRMGLEAKIAVHKYGYYPKGMGEVTLTVTPSSPLKPLTLEKFGTLRNVKGVSVCTFLAERMVAERQAKAANNYLCEKGYATNIQTINDKSNPLQKGSSIALWAETDTGATIGADAIGELGKTSETVGKEAAEKLYAEIAAKPTVDVHLADMLIPYIALAEGKSVFIATHLSDHIDANIWLAEKILGARFKAEKVNSLLRIEKEASKNA